jgi:CHAT domain-containing protein
LANRRQRYAASSFVRSALGLFALAAGVALAVWIWQRASASPLQRFRQAAASLTARPVDGRLSGWPHLPPQRATRSANSSVPPALLRLRGIAGDALLTSHDAHDVAVARLIAGDTSTSIDEFQRAAAKSGDADFWNDYAVACITRSDELDDPTLAIDAVAACDRALTIDARHAAAHFNRGLALTRLGLLTSAADEWKRAAADDPGSPWAAEALQRAHDVPPNALDGWTHALPHIAELDAKQLDALVRAYPQQARTYGESICMTEWADAVVAGDAARAEERLTLARRIGDTLRAFSGESLLHDAVIAADESIRKGTARTLAEAYVIYKSGRIAYSKQANVEAEGDLRKAYGLFASVNSPMALASRYYVGSVLYSRTRTIDSQAVLEDLVREKPDARGYVALAAQIGWERGLCALAAGSVADAVDVFTQSRTLFERIGEPQFAATMGLLIASAYDFSSASSSSWRARRDAFKTLSTVGDVPRIALALTTSASVAARDGNVARAMPLFEMAVEAAERGRNAQLASLAYSRRSALFSKIGDVGAAERDIERARKWLATVHGPAPQAQADLTFAGGVASMRGNPAQAVTEFARAAAFYEAALYRIELPRVHLESARAERALGHIDEARKHLALGIAILEDERRKTDSDQRATLFSGADQIFQEAIEVALLAGDEAGAFNVAEQQRARTLLDEFSKGPTSAAQFATPLTALEIQNVLANDSAIIEYAILPRSVVAFVVRQGRLKVVTIAKSSDAVVQAGKRLSEAADHGNDLVGPGTAAFEMLLRPLLSELRDARRLVFVAPAELISVPFAALYESASGRFLIETASVLEAPSATLAITAARRSKRLDNKRVLAIAATDFDSQSFPGAQPLPSVHEQARRVAAEYKTATIIGGNRATRSEVIKELGNYLIVDIGGHAVIPVIGDRDAALLLAPSAGQRSVLRASEVAQLQLSSITLVILATCRSAVTGSDREQDENLGLAFVAAGVSTVIATTTDLNDADALRIMPRFHRLIAAGVVPDEALRSVLSAEIRDAAGNIQRKSQWATIVLIGGTNDLVNVTLKGKRENEATILVSHHRDGPYGVPGNEIGSRAR